MRLLIVEDNRALLKSLRKGLQEEGFSVDTAEDGEEGLFLAEHNEYDVVILDLRRSRINKTVARVKFVWYFGTK